MGHPAEQKERTHGRIVVAASRIARASGFAGAGVARVMAAAGLTHGGFYAHFRDKWALMEEALHRAFDEAEQNMLGGTEELHGDGLVEEVARRYLSRAHVEHPAAGCAVPALGADVARAPVGVRRVFEERFERIVSLYAKGIGGSRADARARAIALLATFTGALVLARAVHAPSMRDEILAAVRSGVGLAPEADTESRSAAPR